MTDIDTLYREADAVELADHVRSGAVQASELAEAAVRVIEALNPRLNAVVDKRYDIGRAAGVDRGASLAGVPFLIKDLGLSWAGVRARKRLVHRNRTGVVWCCAEPLGCGRDTGRIQRRVGGGSGLGHGAAGRIH